jgi:hypothetical protein
MDQGDECRPGGACDTCEKFLPTTVTPTNTPTSTPAITPTDGQVGTCASTTAAAPTMSPRALALALVVLGGLAAVALRRRRRFSP